MTLTIQPPRALEADDESGPADEYLNVADDASSRGGSVRGGEYLNVADDASSRGGSVRGSPEEYLAVQGNDDDGEDTNATRHTIHRYVNHSINFRVKQKVEPPPVPPKDDDGYQVATGTEDDEHQHVDAQAHLSVYDNRDSYAQDDDGYDIATGTEDGGHQSVEVETHAHPDMYDNPDSYPQDGDDTGFVFPFALLLFVRLCLSPVFFATIALGLVILLSPQLNFAATATAQQQLFSITTATVRTTAATSIPTSTITSTIITITLPNTNQTLTLLESPPFPL